MGELVIREVDGIPDAKPDKPPPMTKGIVKGVVDPVLDDPSYEGVAPAMGIEVLRPAFEAIGVLEPRGMGDAQSKPMAYYEGNVLVIRASAFGNCFGALVRAANGQTGELPPDWLQEKFDEGHTNEPLIIDWIRKQDEWTVLDDWELEDSFGGPLYNGQVRLELTVGESVVIRQHFDGFVRDKAGNVYALEAKALAPSSYATFRRVGLGFMNQYPWQVSIASYSSWDRLWGGHPETQDAPDDVRFLPVLVVVGVKDEDGVCQEFHPHIIEEPPYSRGDIRMRALTIKVKSDEGGEPACDWKQYPCPFWQEKAHKEGVWAKKKAVTAEEAGVDGDALIQAASDYSAGDTMAKQGEKMKKAAKEVLDTLLEGKLDTIVTHGGITVRPQAIKPKQGKIKWEDVAKAKGATDEEAEAYRGASYLGNWYKVETEETE